MLQRDLLEWVSPKHNGIAMCNFITNNFANFVIVLIVMIVQKLNPATLCGWFCCLRDITDMVFILTNVGIIYIESNCNIPVAINFFPDRLGEVAMGAWF